MKTINKLTLPLIMLAIVLTAACQHEKVIYDGPDFIGFSDTLNYLPVVDSDEYFDIPISATKVMDHDRVVAVEIVDSNSIAIEHRDYELASYTVIIPAGQRTANVRARGIFENYDPDEELSFTLRLIVDEAKDWDLYENDTKVVMRKYCPFDINAFVGHCLVMSPYMKQYYPLMSKPKRLTRSELVEGEENTILIKDYFYDGFDFKLTFDLEDPYDPQIKFDEQIFGTTAEAFNNIYGDGKIRIMDVPGAGSFYNNCEDFIMHPMMLKVYNDGSDKTHDAFFLQTQGIIGAYMTAVEWISDAEAEKYERFGY